MRRTLRLYTRIACWIESIQSPGCKALGGSLHKTLPLQVGGLQGLTSATEEPLDEGEKKGGCEPLQQALNLDIGSSLACRMVKIVDQHACKPTQQWVSSQ